MSYPKKILIVDDEADLRDLLAYNLVKSGYDVIESSNGKEAIELTRLERPDLVIMDLMMPEMNGIDACKYIRSAKLERQPIILFFTARSEYFAKQAAQDAGANGYFLKPLAPQRLIASLQKWAS
ncbi:MAG: response regulator [Bacteroidota bacterium]